MYMLNAVAQSGHKHGRRLCLAFELILGSLMSFAGANVMRCEPAATH